MGVRQGAGVHWPLEGRGVVVRQGAGGGSVVVVEVWWRDKVGWVQGLLVVVVGVVGSARVVGREAARVIESGGGGGRAGLLVPASGRQSQVSGLPGWV